MCSVNPRHPIILSNPINDATPFFIFFSVKHLNLSLHYMEQYTCWTYIILNMEKIIYIIWIVFDFCNIYWFSILVHYEYVTIMWQKNL